DVVVDLAVLEAADGRATTRQVLDGVTGLQGRGRIALAGQVVRQADLVTVRDRRVGAQLHVLGRVEDLGGHARRGGLLHADDPVSATRRGRRVEIHDPVLGVLLGEREPQARRADRDDVIRAAVVQPGERIATALVVRVLVPGGEAVRYLARGCPGVRVGRRVAPVFRL